MLMGAEVTLNGSIAEEKRKKISLENDTIHNQIRTSPPNS